MKKSVGMFLLSVVIAGSAWAQSGPSAGMDQGRFMVLAQQIQGVSKLLETQGAVSKEQAQTLLPFFRAIRNTVAMTPVMADWYVRNLNERFTAEQRSAIGVDTEAAAAPTQSAPADTSTPAQTNPGDAAGAANPPTGSEGSGSGGSAPSDTSTPPATQPSDTGTQPPASGTDTSTQQPAAPGTDTQQPAAPTSPEASKPADIQLNLEAPNPFSQAPIVENLDALIAKLTELARG